MGIGCVWPSRGRGSSRDIATRITNNHAAGRNAFSREDYPQRRHGSPFLNGLMRARVLIDIEDIVLFGWKRSFRDNGRFGSSPAPLLRAVFDAYNEIEKLSPGRP